MLDLFSGAGGAAMGYVEAGFEVVGVDIKPQPRYPFEFHQADALSFPLNGFDVIHASPPCQEYSSTARLRDAQGKKGTTLPLLEPVRVMLARSGLPYVIENVPRAPLIAPVWLCGTMFGLGVERPEGWRPLRRHRGFESNAPLIAPLDPHRSMGRPLGVYGSMKDDIPQGGQTVQSVEEAQRIMGIDWMSRWDELKESIPPGIHQVHRITTDEGRLVSLHVAQAFTVDAALDQWIERHTLDRPADGAYHPSTIFMCDRKTIYEVRATPREDAFKPGDRRPLFIGNTLGPVLQSAIEAQVGTTLRYAVSEPRIDVAEWNVVGNADAFVVHADGTPEVIENKTIGSNAYYWANKKGELPKPEHVNQGLTYLLAIKRHGYFTEEPERNDLVLRLGEPPRMEWHDPVPDLTRLRVVYWEKSAHPITEFSVTLTDEWEEGFYRHLATLDRYRADGTALPMRMPKDYWGCNYCAWANRCWKIDKEGVRL